MPTLDRFARPLRSLRVSVTDRCNLRCQYCMPETDYAWLPRDSVLTFEEIAVLVDAFTDLGVDRVRLTGGEPLLRRDLPVLVEALASRPALRDLALTTNGVLLAKVASDLAAAGLHRITVSLDTLDPDRFTALTRFDEHAAVLRGIERAASAGFASVKLDMVVMRGVNEDELVPMLEYSRLAAHYGPIVPLREASSAPAQRFRLDDGLVFGIIASTTAPFCADCDRARLTADGVWLMCLYARAGTDLRRPLRAGADPSELRRLIATVWESRADRGAEERLIAEREETLIPVAALRKDAHLEMHTRGG
jgi:cyclic pyranopterin phosphate synthase